MTEVQKKVIDDIITVIRDNLQLLIRNNDLCLYYLIEYCKNIGSCNLPIDQELLTKFTEDSLYALLNADFLYDFRELE